MNSTQPQPDGEGDSLRNFVREVVAAHEGRAETLRPEAEQAGDTIGAFTLQGGWAKVVSARCGARRRSGRCGARLR